MRTLRPWTIDDLSEFHDAVVESLDHLAPFMAWARESASLTIEERRPFLENWIAQSQRGEDFHFGYFQGQRLLAVIGLHPRIGEGGLEIGYWVRATEANKGHTSAAVQEVIELAFAKPEIDHVEIVHDVANIPSGRIAEKLGFFLVREFEREIDSPGQVGRAKRWRLARSAHQI